MTELAPEQHIRLEVVKLYAQTYEFLPLKDLREDLYEISSWIITGETVEPNAPQEPAEGDAGTAEGADSTETQDANEAETSGDIGVHVGRRIKATSLHDESIHHLGTFGTVSSHDNHPDATFFIKMDSGSLWAAGREEFEFVENKISEAIGAVEAIKPQWKWDPDNPSMPPWSRNWCGSFEPPVSSNVEVLVVLRDGQILIGGPGAFVWGASFGANGVIEYATLDPKQMPEEGEQ